MNWGYIFYVLGCVFQIFTLSHTNPMKSTKKASMEKEGTEIFHPRIYALNEKERRTSREFLFVAKTSESIFYLHLKPTEVNHSLKMEQPSVVVPTSNNSCQQYMGKSLIGDDAEAAISLCGSGRHVFGVILNGDRAHVIRPLTPGNRKLEDHDVTTLSNDVIPHVIYSPEDLYKSFCGMDMQDYRMQDKVPMKSRRRRADESGRKVIETAVYIDYTLYKKMSLSSGGDTLDKIRDTVLAIVNEVQLIYNYNSLHTKFKIVVVKLEVLTENEDGPDPADGDIDQYLDNFCSWQSLRNPPDSSKEHWDHALMLTGLNLYKTTSGGSRNEKVLGLAWVNGMCRPQHSCTLNEGSSFEAAFVIAHEMGHSLGMLHDGRGNDCDPNIFLMSEKTGPGKITWSSCSNEYLDKYFEKGYGSCLEDDNDPPEEILNHEGQLPGHRFSLADQCILSLGKNFKPHVVPRPPFDDVCRELWCVSGLWASVAHPALEGSACGNQKYCHQGICIDAQPDSSSYSAENGLKMDLKGTVADFLDRLKYAFKLLAV